MEENEHEQKISNRFVPKFKHGEVSQWQTKSLTQDIIYHTSVHYSSFLIVKNKYFEK